MKSKLLFIFTLWNHGLAKFGLIVLSFFITIAITGYMICPDKSTDANTIILPFANKKPGFKGTVFYKPLGINTQQQSLFSIWKNGKKKQFEPIPIQAHRFANNTLYYSVYVGGNNKSLNHIYPFKTKPIIKEKKYWLGTDEQGRDMLSRLILGSRISLMVGLISVTIATILGIIIGLFAGYFGGWTDRILSWFISVWWSLPTLLLVFAVSFALGKGLWQVIIAIGISSWVEIARIVRGEVMSIKQKEYIEAAKVLGIGHFQIIFKHILPNVKNSIIVVSVSVFSSAILLEAGLGFLGLGVSRPTPSWGLMVKEYFGYIVLDSAYMAILPGLCIILLVMSFNFLGVGLRDVMDKKN